MSGRRRSCGRFGAAVLAVVLAWPQAVSAQEPVDPIAARVAATSHSPDQFLATFDDALLPGLGMVGPAPAITGDPGLDARIRAIGEARGYRRRPEPNTGLASVDGYLLQPNAAAAWESLQGAAAGAGHSLRLTSAYRSVASQISIFRGKLSGTSDSAIDTRLQTVAVPGYSKHHTGYAIDMRSSTGSGFAFRNTAAYAWLAADNFANAKAHGWIPSYPEGSAPAGPVPEPWEFVWVGARNIICGDFEPSADEPFCDTVGSTFAPDVAWLWSEGLTTGCRPGRYCIDSEITRAQTATFLWRMAGEPAATPHAAFTDVIAGSYYERAVGWLATEGITTGTTPSTFSPERPVSRAELVTFLWRALDEPIPVDDASAFEDVAPDGFASVAVRWAAEVGVTTGTSPTRFSPDATATRGQMAAFLHRTSVL